MWSMGSKKTLRLIWYHRVIVFLALLIVLSIIGYHNMLTYHMYRIVSQRMYAYGFSRHLHGNLLRPSGTYAFEDLLHEPSDTKQLKKKTLYLLILVSSGPHSKKHALQRAAIRKTWGDCQNLNNYKNEYASYVKTKQDISCKIYFYMGKSLVEARNEENLAELEEHNDLVIGDFIDNYHNMTRKILFGLNWASRRFQPEYILKTDDDVFMNLPKLIYLLSTKYTHVEDLYGGHIYYATVVRDNRHRHYLTREELPDDWYPPFNKGGQMILSGHLLDKLLEMSTRMNRFQIDDAYIGVLMNRIGVLPTKVKELALSQYHTYLVSWRSTCDLKSLAGIGDNLSPSQLNYISNIVHKEASWYCIRIDALVYYAFLLTLIIFFVLFCMRQRYCPWLTWSVIWHGSRAVIKKLKT